MSIRYIPPKPPVKNRITSSRSLTVEEAQSLLASYLERTTTLPTNNSNAAKPAGSNLWNHTHDAGTTAALRKIELSMRGYTPDKLAQADEFMFITGLDMEQNFGNGANGTTAVRDGSVFTDRLDRDEGYSEGNQRALQADDLENDSKGENSDSDRMEIMRLSQSPALERRRAYDGGETAAANVADITAADENSKTDKEKRERKRRKQERRQQEKLERAQSRKDKENNSL